MVLAIGLVAVLVGGLEICGGVTRAAPPRPGLPVPLEPAVPIWVVDKAASRLTFRGSAAGQIFDGVFKKWDAQVAFDPRRLRASHVEVTVDVGSLVTGDPTRDQMLPGPDWFGAAKFPKASFVTTAIVSTAPGRYLASGILTIRGVRRRVSMPFALDGVRDTATVTGSLGLDRNQFGVGQGPSATPDKVAAGVLVQVRLTAKTSR